jgi:hypothetical protein
MDSSALRVAPSFGSTLTRSVASPRPLVGATLSHPAVLAALHSQTACVRTSIVRSPPSASTGSAAAETR